MRLDYPQPPPQDALGTRVDYPRIINLTYLLCYGTSQHPQYTHCRYYVSPRLYFELCPVLKKSRITTATCT